MNCYVEHYQLVVSDLATAAHFYSTVFGWPVRGRGREFTVEGTYQWVHVGTDETYIALRAPFNDLPFDDGMRGYRGNHVGIVTDEIEQVIGRLNKLGYLVRQGPSHPHRRRFYVRDFDNNEIEIIQYRTNKNEERNDYTILNNTELDDMKN